MVGWHHGLYGHEFEQAPGVGDGQGSMVCCSPWACKESDTTEQLNCTERSVRKDVCVSRSVVFDSLQSHALQPTRLLCPWDSLAKNTGVDCQALLQGIFPTQGSTCLSCSSCIAGAFFTTEPLGKPTCMDSHTQKAGISGYFLGRKQNDQGQGEREIFFN